MLDEETLERLITALDEAKVPNLLVSPDHVSFGNPQDGDAQQIVTAHALMMQAWASTSPEERLVLLEQLGYALPEDGKNRILNDRTCYLNWPPDSQHVSNS
jgi:hypothetical protein